MDLKQKLLALIMLDIRYFGCDNNGDLLPQLKLHQEVEQLLLEYPIGGVILFRENLDNAKQTINLTSQLQELSTSHDRLIAIDEEGGVVSRFNFGIDTVGNMALGLVDDVCATTSTANMVGNMLSNLGINTNLAPVVDVNSNLNNPIIGVRSFGEDANLVAKHSAKFIKGLHEQNIISCAKHFPGHGDTDTDTHLSVTYVKHDRSKLDEIDLPPFNVAIAANVDMVMAAHVVVPALDDNKIHSQLKGEEVEVPATLSNPIITKLLKNKLKFDGVVISDALDMKAITDNFDMVEASILALKAGVDILLMPVRIWNINGINEFKQYFEKLYHSCMNDQELQNRVDDADDRVTKLKNKIQLLHDTKKVDVQNINQLINNQQDIQLQKNLAKRAVTIYKDENSCLPIKLRMQDQILIIANKGYLLNEVTNYLPHDISIDKCLVDYTNLDDINKLTSIIENDQHAGYKSILVLTYNLTDKDILVNQIFDHLNQKSILSIMLSCRNPYDYRYASSAKTVINAYGVTGFDQTSKHIKPFTLNVYAALDRIFKLVE